MNYELALELKNAGFPLQECTLEGCYYSGDSLDEDDKNYHYPTLSELIEACGLYFGSLVQCQKPIGQISKYLCNSYNDVAPIWVQTEGSTQEQAVAKLWLAINSPKQSD